MFSPLELVDNELNCKAKWDFVPLKYNLLKKYGWRIFRYINKNFDNFYKKQSLIME